MDDSIFDDVDAILNEEISSEAEVLEDDKSFNEEELHDIMSEIENLEKEFVGEKAPMSLQEQIDAELAAELDEINSAEVPETSVQEMEMMEEVVAASVSKVTPVVEPVAPMATFTKPSVVSEIPKSENKSEVSFQAHGQMSFNLDFKVGADVAKLTVDPVKGLMVTVSGVEVWINEDSGCSVSMENGMKFTIPLSSQTNSLKKKAA